MHQIKILSLIAFLFATLQISSSEVIKIGNVEMADDAKSEAFEQVRKKIGKWEGKMVQGLDGNVKNRQIVLEIKKKIKSITFLICLVKTKFVL